MSNLIVLVYSQTEFWRKIRKEAIEKFGAADFTYYLKTNTGSIVNSITMEMNKFITGVKGYLDSINAGLLLTGYGLMLVSVSLKATLILFILGLLFNYIFLVINRFSKKLSMQLTLINQDFSRNLIETVNYFKYLKATNSYKFKSNIIEKVIDEFYVVRTKIGLANGLPNVIQEPITLIIVALLFWLNSLFIKESLEVIFVILGIAYRASAMLANFQSKRQLFFSSLGSLENVQQFLKELEQYEEEMPKNGYAAFQDRISLKNLSFAYQPGRDVLKDLNLDINKNQTVALVGPSGAGKSTLVDILTGIQKPQSGEIIIDDVTHKDLTSEQWRSQIGYVTQENIVFDGNVYTNVSLRNNRNALDEAMMEKALEWSNSIEFISKMDDKYNTPLGERGIRLSGGQRQRISIARELYKDPALLILDEATSALDSLSEKLIQQSIDGLKGKTTVVIIAHRLSTVKNVDRIYVLKDGQVVEQGTYDELNDIPDGQFRKMVTEQRL